MFNKVKNIIILLSFITFFMLTFKYYFSEKNIVFTNKSRTSFAIESNKVIANLPLLENDTSNIIIYKNDLEEFKKKRKKRFWEKLLSDDN